MYKNVQYQLTVPQELGMQKLQPHALAKYFWAKLNKFGKIWAGKYCLFITVQTDCERTAQDVTQHTTFCRQSIMEVPHIVVYHQSTSPFISLG